MATINQSDKQMAELYAQQPEFAGKMLNASLADGDFVRLDSTIRQIQIAQGLEPMPYKDLWSLQNITATELHSKLLSIGYKAVAQELTQNELKALEEARKEQAAAEDDGDSTDTESAAETTDGEPNDNPNDANDNQSEDQSDDDDQNDKEGNETDAKPRDKVSETVSKAFKS